jgi:hypothetical protein
LSDVALRVLRRVEEQSEYRRRELRAANAPRFEERRLRRRLQLLECSFNRRVKSGKQRRRDICCAVWLRLAQKRRLLRRRERLAASVRKQAIDATGRVTDVKAD